MARLTTIGLSLAALFALSAIGLLLIELAGGEKYRVWQAWQSFGLELPDPLLPIPALLTILNFPLWGALMVVAVLLGGCFGVIRYANDH